MSGHEPTPRVSIVITNHNYGRYLTEAVDSAMAQTVRCQVVVVDDGSTDDSASVLADLEARHGHRLTAIRRSNGGQAAAMNTAWPVIEAPYVLFLDADDRLAPQAMALVSDRFDADLTAAKCMFRLGAIDGEGRPLAGGLPEPERLLPAGDLRSRLAVDPDDIPWQPTSGNAFRATALAAIMPIPEAPYRISADHYLSNLTALAGPVLAIEQALGDYRIHGANHDHRAEFDIGRARDILVRTEETRGHLVRRGREVGVAMPSSPDGFRSLTTAATRLASHRIGGEVGGGHPFDADRRWSLAARALDAARRRRDLSATRRVLAVGWVVALAVVPRRLVASVAARGLTR